MVGWGSLLGLGVAAGGIVPKESLRAKRGDPEVVELVPSEVSMVSGATWCGEREQHE